MHSSRSPSNATHSRNSPIIALPRQPSILLSSTPVLQEIHCHFFSFPPRPFHTRLSRSMWNQLPLDLLAHVFCYLPPDSLVRALSACKHWRCAASHASSAALARHPAWLLAMPVRGHALYCYAQNPISHRWHSLPLDFVPHPIRLVAPLGGLLLCKLSASPSLRLALCNPFTRQYHPLPDLKTPRSNPAVGVISMGAGFYVYVAGGTSGGCYEPTMEVFDSLLGRWRCAGPMPTEFAVRLTVWTPNESVEAGGAIYWMTSARAYSVVGLEVGREAWREVRAPMADRLEWAALIQRGGGKLGLVGGACYEDGWVWELEEGDKWAPVGVVPAELGKRFWGRRGGWGGTRCVGSDTCLYLFRDLGSDMLLWREVSIGKQRRWEWSWVQGCCGSSSRVAENGLPNFPIRGVLLHPTLSLSPAWFHEPICC